ncbi:HlyC/CorC family transporter [Candidatus Poribacteria bacterium]|nr:HlyC/CorC family transporter [Candidatus Poribacteria bacterium]
MNKSSFFITFMIFCWFACIAAIVALHAQQLSWSVISVYVSLLLVSMILSFFFSGTEVALVSANKVRMGVLAENGDKQAAIVKRLLDAPDRMLGMLLVGNNLVNVAAGHAGAVLTGYALILVTDSQKIQGLINTVVMTALILMFSELLPKTIFRAKADALSLRFAPALRVSTIIFHVVVSLITKLTNLIVAIASRGADAETATTMREELRLLAAMGAQEGIIEQEQRRMIHSVLDLESRTVEKVMTPLVDIVAVEKNSSVEELYRVAAENNFSRIPVYDGQIYNIIGLINILDVLYSENPSEDISPYIRRDIQFVPESKRVDALLRELQAVHKVTSELAKNQRSEPRHNPIAFVVDEYGGIIGLVTIKDLVEEVVGQIQDEYDEEEYIHAISDRDIECDGRMEIIELNHRFGTNIPVGEYETIAGYVIYLMEKIPRTGEYVDTDELRILVLDADARSVQKVRIHNKVSKFI